MTVLRLFFLSMLLTLTLPLQAQEQDVQVAPPAALDDEFINWMIGEWEGATTSDMGNSSDHMKCEMGLNDQFLIVTYKSDPEDGRSIWGMGAITQDPEGNAVGYWIDSWRTMYTGKGFREDNISTMKWSTQQGIYIRTTERIDDNTMRVTGSITDAAGHEVRSESEFKRVTSKPAEGEN
jgi:hypothetical protein